MKHAYVVKVPRPHAKPYNPDRPITDLVRNQILHLSLAERHLPKHHRSGMDVYSIKTDVQASEYIRHVTSKLHEEGAKKPQVSKEARPEPPKLGKKRRSTNRRKKTQS
jgi:hypothetical protein